MYSKLFLFACLTLISLLSNAQAPSWQWAKSAGGTGQPDSKSVIDSIGNIYVTGTFQDDTMAFGNNILINSHQNGLDIFIVKYDASGNVLWAKSGTGYGNDWSGSIGLDKNGFIYITGYFTGSFITFGGITLTNGSSSNIFIVKYDSSGNVVWAKSDGGSGSPSSVDIDVKPNGTFYITGAIQSNTISLGGITLTNNAGMNNFVAKYNNLGNVIWAKSCGGYVKSIDSDKNDNVYVAGFFTSPIMSIGTTTLTNNSTDGDIFLIKYDALGNVIWAKSAGGSKFDGINAIAIDSSSNVYITGVYNSTSITFGATTLINANGTSASYAGDSFLAKYDANGNVLFAKNISGKGFDDGIAIKLDKNENIFLLGNSGSDTLNFGNTIITNVFIYIAKFDVVGNVIWVKHTGVYTNLNDIGCSLALDLNGNAFITGKFRSATIPFDNTVLANSTGTFHFFAAKLGGSAGIKENSNSSVISIYPNPNNGNFYIKGSVTANYKLINELGQTVKEIELNSKNNFIITLDNLTSGMYFIIGSNNHQTISKKIIVTK